MTIIKKNIKGNVRAKKGIKIGIVKSTYNSEITDALESSCIKELKKAGVSEKNIWIVEVPGAFELPFSCQKLIKSKKVDAVIAIGAVIKGQTPHFDFIANSASIGIMDVSLKMNVPIIFCVLTTNNITQAKARIKGGNRGDKGIEATRAALKILNT
jgi:6,7-dimethyl-8-ribityllumazine synthase